MLAYLDMPALESLPPESVGHPMLCFMNPAIMPEWFWLPVAKALEQEGYDYVIPDLHRGDPNAAIDNTIIEVEKTIDNYDRLYIVALSRGVEFAVRYLDRMAKQDKLQNVLGWMVISSVGPRGYEEGMDMPRHNAEHLAGIHLDAAGLEVIDDLTLSEFMMHDVEDKQLRQQIIDDKINERPLDPSEVRAVPQQVPALPTPAWYIGRNDIVDNVSLSAFIAEKRFRASPIVTGWGHVGPLTHTDEVVNVIRAEISAAEQIGRPS